jgi:hypothetical protein
MQFAMHKLSNFYLCNHASPLEHLTNCAVFELACYCIRMLQVGLVVMYASTIEKQLNELCWKVSLAKLLTSVSLSLVQSCWASSMKLELSTYSISLSNPMESYRILYTHLCFSFHVWCSALEQRYFCSSLAFSMQWSFLQVTIKLNPTLITIF